jgi:hypothetical protein
MADVAQALPNLSREDLNRIAEQVAKILGLQQLDDGSTAEAAALFGRSTMSKVCSARSVGCEIHTGAAAVD